MYDTYIVHCYVSITKRNIITAIRKVKHKDQGRLKRMESSHRGGEIKGKIVGVCMGACACVYLHIGGAMERVASESIHKQFEKIRNEDRGTC